MTPEQIMSIAKLGAACALGLSAIGSCLGAGVASFAAIGSWKKCYQQNKLAPFMLVAFIGAPLSQTIYGMILMGFITKAAAQVTVGYHLLGIGILSGLAIGASAYFQGKAGAYGADALAETGKGFGNYLMALGIIETIAILVLIFSRNVL